MYVHNIKVKNRVWHTDYYENFREQINEQQLMIDLYIVHQIHFKVNIKSEK